MNARDFAYVCEAVDFAHHYANILRRPCSDDDDAEYAAEIRAEFEERLAVLNRAGWTKVVEDMRIFADGEDAKVF